MSVEFANYSMSHEIKYEQPWYDWCVFASADRTTIDRIASVQYHLHPSFPNPIRMTTDKKHRFPLITDGWREFSIGIHLTFTDGTSESTSYWLRLSQDNWPKKAAPAQFATAEHQAVYGVLTEGPYRWRKLKTLIAKTGLPEDSVRQLLKDLENEDLARRALVPSIDGQEMWAATLLVGVLPHL